MALKWRPEKALKKVKRRVIGYEGGYWETLRHCGTVLQQFSCGVSVNLTSKCSVVVLHNEEPCLAQTLQNVTLLEGFTYDKTRTSHRLIFFILENDDVT